MTWNHLVISCPKGSSCLVLEPFIDFYNPKGPSHDPFLRIRFLLVSKIRSCEHIENDLPTHGSVILKKWMETEHALFLSDTLLER